MEFSSAYGLKKGTNVNFKGVTVGYIYNISVKPNKVVVLIHVNSSDILIPKNSLIEANQVGLFNDIVIDITLLDNLSSIEYQSVNPSSIKCLRSSFICSNFYVKGYKGLNYDDLVRATTRISQRFDDPRFFNLFYILLQNSIDISNEIEYLINYTSYLFFYLANLFILLVLRYFV
uniref:Ycf22 n=1 Tax=Laurencia obtusa TaxID=137763 RepID=UPI0028D8B881|nr:Ycf22 [Laurencia obtusa]WMP12856.1 Ycf22 [Laurencia obtusa]